MKKILVVDDSRTLYQQVQCALVSYQVDHAEDGAEGLVLLHQKRFDLVFVDVHLPRMNGIEMVKRAQESGIDVPILMLTSEVRPEVIQQAKNAGVTAWLIKPMRPDMLVAVADKITNGRRDRTTTSRLC